MVRSRPPEELGPRNQADLELGARAPVAQCVEPALVEDLATRDELVGPLVPRRCGVLLIQPERDLERLPEPLDVGLTQGLPRPLLVGVGDDRPRELGGRDRFDPALAQVGHRRGGQTLWIEPFEYVRMSSAGYANDRALVLDRVLEPLELPPRGHPEGIVGRSGDMGAMDPGIGQQHVYVRGAMGVGVLGDRSHQRRVRGFGMDQERLPLAQIHADSYDKPRVAGEALVGSAVAGHSGQANRTPPEPRRSCAAIRLMVSSPYTCVGFPSVRTATE